MKLQWMYVICFLRRGELLQYATNDAELFQRELSRIRCDGGRVVSTQKCRI